MNANREKEIFLGALELGAGRQRERFVAEKCAGDEDLEKGVRQLLSSLDESEELLDPQRFESLEEERSRLGRALSEEARLIERCESRVERVGDYELLEEIGRGAMGIVFRARQVSLNRQVALKIVLNAALATESERQRFRLEAEAAARLEHPGIVPVYEVGSHEEHDYYSMALIEGGTLAQRMKADQPPTPRDAVELILRILDAVRFAHERGVIHRDLKPENILITATGEPMVSDFGLARMLEREVELTLTGQLMGTPRYMAPELIEDSAAASTLTDLYAMGAILYELLRGQPVFDGGSVLSTLRMIEEEMPATLQGRTPKVDRDLDTIVLKCLEKEPERRYRSLRALRDDLEAWLEHRPIAARPPGTLERLGKWVQRRPAHAALGLLALMVLLLVGVGGPWIAVHQSSLRAEAERAKGLAEEARAEAEESAEDARRQAAVNRSLAYSANQRYIQLTHEWLGDSSLASEVLISGWIPKAGEEDLRGWEWFFNYARIHADQRSFNTGNPVNSIAISPRGTRVATSDARGTVIHNAFTGALIRRLPEKDGHLKSVWNSSGDRLLTLDSEGALSLWDPANGSQSHLLPDEDRILDVDWHEQTLVTLQAERFALWQIVDAHAAEIRESVPASEYEWKKLGLSPDGAFLAATGTGPEVAVWKTASPAQPPLLLDGASSTPVDFDWKADSRWLAASTEGGTFRIWEVPSGQRILRHDTLTSQPVRGLAWNPNDEQLAFLAPSNTQLNVMDLVESKVKPVRGFIYTLAQSAIDWSGESHTLAVGTEQGRVFLLRYGLPPVETLLELKGESLLSLCWPTVGGMISYLDGHGGIHQYNPVTRERSQIAAIERTGKRMLTSWNRESGALAVASDGEVRIVLNPRESKFSGQRTSIPQIISLLWLNRREMLACGSRGEIELLGGTRHKSGFNPIEFQLPSPEAPAIYDAFSVSPNGRHLLGTGRDERLTLWSMTDGSVRSDRSQPGRNTSGDRHTWHPDGSAFCTGTHAGMISFWDLEQEAPLHRVQGHDGPVTALAWHPHGNRVASAGQDGRVRIWNPETGEMLLSLKSRGFRAKAHSAPVQDLIWGPEGRRLASCGADGRLVIWDAAAGYLLSE